MFKINDLQHTVTAAIGAILVSATFIGASIGPVRTDQVISSSMPAVAAGPALSV